jgi:hypothetical protein
VAETVGVENAVTGNAGTGVDADDAYFCFQGLIHTSQCSFMAG